MKYSENNRRQFLKALTTTLCAGGASALLPQLKLMGSALAATTAPVPNYRALVCVYLAGGNDSWNMLLPYDTARHGVYATARGGVYNANTNAAGLGIDRALLTSQFQITDSAALESVVDEVLAGNPKAVEDFAAGEEKIVGVNDFFSEDTEPLEILKIDPEVERKQVESLKKVKAGRDAAAVQRRLEDLKDAACTKTNLMPLILDAVRVYSSVGEIMGTLREVWGEYHDPCIL